MKRIKLFNKILSLALSAFIISVNFSGCSSEEKGEMRDMTTQEIVEDMGLGINLGNTFDSFGWSASTVTAYETGWGSPVITQAMIQGYADCGFGVLRVPVSWSNLMTGDYDISPEYLARVKEVVDWALDSGMYVILNIHKDGTWFEKFATDDKDECMYKYERIWTQLTDEFKNYSDKLMFESLNEEGGWDSLWNRYTNVGDKEKSFGILNEINQKFVDIVRSSGGNNPKRHLLIAGYNTDFELTCDDLFKMPDDPAGRCAVSVHYYNPPTFCVIEKDTDWGKARTDWGTDADYDDLYRLMDMVKEHFVDNGIPVIIGEYGCTIKNKEDEVVRTYISSVAEAAYTRSMCPVAWDATDHFYSRYKAEFIDQELLERLMEVKNSERN